MSRPAIAHIRLDAFRHNYRVAKQSHAGFALAVIKANAYGHGAVQCAKAIENEADGFAVASLEEALTLRQAAIKNPILLLEGFFEAQELPEIVANDLWIVVHAKWQLNQLLAAKLSKPLHVWLKLDSGMHRVGLSPAEYVNAFARLVNHQNIAKIVHMSHFANADDLASPHTQQQVAVFQQTINQLASSHLLSNANNHSVETSLANSAAILGWPQAQANWSRPGIMLYGAHPLTANVQNQTELTHLKQQKILRPVMQLTSKIISIRTISKGESIGYGSIFTAQRDTKVGVVACGYADGYPRLATSANKVGAPVAVDGKVTQLIGRVSMDMLFVDLTDIPNAEIGSDVELWGDQVAANDVAKSANTIAYELFCNVKRVQFRYSDND
ncbi:MULTISPECIES: alanine racemase [Methylotenera]|uniref:alanine racemase n=1 Tax=Methylotenera TaxID=359407 RepID=UPI00036589F6|nr:MULTISPECIES: alanine racemase [Methylotenera]